MEDPTRTHALVEAARSLDDPWTVADTLEAIVTAGGASVPGFEHVGISVVRGMDKMESQAVTDRLVWELDEVQYALLEGPCIESLRTVSTFAVEHLRHDHRWPRYVPAAVGHGVLSQLALRSSIDEDTLGCINFYGTQSATLHDGAVEMAELFAAQAAIALGPVIRQSTVDLAPTTRGDIGQAVGLTMARFELAADLALQCLVRASSASHVALADVARVVVGQLPSWWCAGASG